ncbi:MAG: OHCU decarboxylase [Halobacteriovorax sp.]|nr:OHCU decarboxylase [Halobacteriovorax sp.]|tara:strand:- start:155239 stop:155739 length:501 start_codon:yes stop_codon:yes gene_type:complete
MNLNEFNSIPESELLEVLNTCCTSGAWQKKVVAARPYPSIDELYSRQEEIWKGLSKEDYLEAFDGHPKIGDVSSLKKKYAHTKALASGEQSGVDSASDKTIQELAELNTIYENRFGYIFIVCATGKSALEMLEILKSRIDNDPEEELKISAGEQAKITKIRMEKLL